MLELISTPETWVSLLTLTALEIVLGIDNIVFITILAGKLPHEQQLRARRLGLGMALITRLLLLLTLSWLMGLDAPLFSLLGRSFSGRELILVTGGLFLIGKATFEIYEKLEVAEQEKQAPSGSKVMTWIVLQIMLLDIVFSLDSVITAIGMVKHVPVMMAAVVLAVIVMMIFAGPIGDFIEDHPSMKILALAFLLLVGVLLVAESLGQHVNKSTIYFAMAFSLGVELLNMRMRKRGKQPVQLHSKISKPSE